MNEIFTSERCSILVWAAARLDLRMVSCSDSMVLMPADKTHSNVTLYKGNTTKWKLNLLTRSVIHLRWIDELLKWYHSGATWNGMLATVIICVLHTLEKSKPTSWQWANTGHKHWLTSPDCLSTARGSLTNSTTCSRLTLPSSMEVEEAGRGRELTLCSWVSNWKTWCSVESSCRWSISTLRWCSSCSTRIWSWNQTSGHGIHGNTS